MDINKIPDWPIGPKVKPPESIYVIEPGLCPGGVLGIILGIFIPLGIVALGFLLYEILYK